MLRLKSPHPQPEALRFGKHWFRPSLKVSKFAQLFGARECFESFYLSSKLAEHLSLCRLQKAGRKGQFLDPTRTYRVRIFALGAPGRAFVTRAPMSRVWGAQVRETGQGACQEADKSRPSLERWTGKGSFGGGTPVGCFSGVSCCTHMPINDSLQSSGRDTRQSFLQRPSQSLWLCPQNSLGSTHHKSTPRRDIMG